MASEALLEGVDDGPSQEPGTHAQHTEKHHHDGHDVQEHVPWEHNAVQAFDNVGYELDKFGKNAAYELDKFGKNVANFFGGWR